MNLAVFLDQRYHRTPDGTVWTDGPMPYTFFERYLRVFDQVRVVARVGGSGHPSEKWKPASGPGVTFSDLPYYVGAWQYLTRARRVRARARASLGWGDAVILRVPSQVSTCVEASLRRRGQPFGVEVVGDPFHSYAPGSVRHPLRPLFRYWFRHRLRQQCAEAAVSAYVTAETLQRRYPPAAGAYATHYSSVELPAAAFAAAPRAAESFGTPLRIITVGSLQYLYKGADLLIDAVAALAARGLDLRLRIAGGGRYQSTLSERAARAGIANRTEFLGQLPSGEAIRAALDSADLFVLPSRAEGLPRAMIEAMARGLPAIGSSVGGIPELLPGEDLFPSGDAGAIADKIAELAASPARLAAMSARNLEEAGQYQETLLRDRRDGFYRRLREQTERWLRRAGVSNGSPG